MQTFLTIYMFVILLVYSYMLGSVPTGYCVGKWVKGINIMEHGSGNIGTTNTFRVLGKKWGIFVFAVDFLKGMAACWIGSIYFGEIGSVICGFVAVIGHTYSIFLDLKGGKGVATAAGVLFFNAPLVLFVAFAVWAFVTVATSYVSVGSISACVAAVIMSFLLISHWSVDVFVVFVSIFIVYKHRSNIQRLLQGTENKIQWYKPKNVNVNKTVTIEGDANVDNTAVDDVVIDENSDAVKDDDASEDGDQDGTVAVDEDADKK